MSGLGELTLSSAHPSLKLEDLDARVSHLQAHALEKSTIGGYSTSAHDYIRFCHLHQLPLDPTPQTLSRWTGGRWLSDDDSGSAAHRV